MSQKFSGAIDDGVDIERKPLADRLPAEIQQAIYNLLAPQRLVDDLLEILTPLLIVGQVPHEKVGKHQNTRKGVIDFVSDTRRQSSDRGNLFSLDQLTPGLLKFPAYFQAFPEIGKYANAPNLTPVLLYDCR
jgi:hypothetical protein